MKMSDFDELKNFKLFVKFTQGQYVNDILKGKIYMKNLNYFIQLEEKEKKKGKGDKREAGFVYEAQDILIFDIENNKLIGRAKKGEVIKRYEKAGLVPVFCFTMFTSTDFVLYEQKDDYISFRLDIGEDTNKLLEFGDTAIILPTNFHQLLIDTADSKGIIGRVNQVSYDSYDKLNEEREKLFNAGSTDMFFWKHNDFKHQRECRLILPNTLVDDYYILNINDIEKDCVVVPINQFLNSSAIIAPLKPVDKLVL